MLLGLEGVVVGRQLGRGDDIRQEHELPAQELRAVRQVEILGQGVRLPASRRLDAGPPPDSGGAVEVEEAAGAVPRGMLDDEVAVQADRLDAGQNRVLAIEVAPARLNHPDARVAEVMHEVEEERRRRHEIGVEHGDELALRPGQPVRQRPGLESFPRPAAQVHDVVPEAAHRLDRRGGETGRVVGRIVEHLDLQAAGRVVQGAGGPDEPLDDVALVVDRELDGHVRQRIEPLGGARAVSPVPVEEVQEIVSVQAVDRQHQERRIVGRDDSTFDDGHAEHLTCGP